MVRWLPQSLMLFSMVGGLYEGRQNLSLLSKSQLGFLLLNTFNSLIDRLITEAFLMEFINQNNIRVDSIEKMLEQLGTDPCSSFYGQDEDSILTNIIAQAANEQNVINESMLGYENADRNAVQELWLNTEAAERERQSPD